MIQTVTADNTTTFHEIVAQARDLVPNERDEFVRRVCGHDETLLSLVLIALGDRQGEQAAPFQEDEERTAAPLEGQRLGQYRIVSKIGTGGMGEVYLAERADEEYRQRVAIKLVRAGGISTQMQGRLRVERQILAKLQHPNIARLLDGGRAPDGTPYLVMEYIEGEPIDVYCDRRRLGISERIRLMQSVCSAVHYAHQNLIVHRDLKPNNILITEEGVPKLLDFGIAKLLDNHETMNTVAVTHFEYRVMTPAHASPEQVRGDLITTASDTYVLGILLYELLCGHRPLHLDTKRLPEIERIVCEEQPLSPSAMVARSMKEQPELARDIAGARGTTPERLQQRLKGDIDNIILLALRKEPGRRYASVEQLAGDLDRHLRRLPVTAAPDTWSYRTRKFVARHRYSVPASILVVLALTAFAIVTYIQAQRIAHERDVTAAERSRAEQISSFLVELFQLSDPSHSRGNQVTARELLDVGARRVSYGLADQPETRATLLETIGRVYGSLGLYGDSVPLLEDALASRKRVYGEKHLQVAAAMSTLGDALRLRGEFGAAEKYLNSALAMERELAGPDAVETGPTLRSLGLIEQQRGDLVKAEQDLQQALGVYRKSGKERDADNIDTLSDLAGLYMYRGDFERAVNLLRDTVVLGRETLGADHPKVAIWEQNLGMALNQEGQLAEAEPLYAHSIASMRKFLGDAHPNTIDALANYARFLRKKGDLKQAADVLKAALTSDRKVRGPSHPYVAHDLVSLGYIQLDSGDAVDAEQSYREALNIYGQSLPRQHPFVASALTGLGRSLTEQHRSKEAEATLREATDIAVKTLPADSPIIAQARASLGIELADEHRGAEALPLLRDNLAAVAVAQGEEATMTKRGREALARLLAPRREAASH